MTNKKALTKSELFTELAERTELTRKQVGALFSALDEVIDKNLRGAGVFTLPSLLKLKVIKKPATKARKGTNPFTGEEMMFKAKPAMRKVKALPLKKLKEMVAK